MKLPPPDLDSNIYRAYCPQCGEPFDFPLPHQRRLWQLWESGGGFECGLCGAAFKSPDAKNSRGRHFKRGDSCRGSDNAGATHAPINKGEK